MKKEIIKKIAELEKKLALSYDEYRKLHPKTKKKPSDPMFKMKENKNSEEEAIQKYENQGLTRSDAQAAAQADELKRKNKKKTEEKPNKKKFDTKDKQLKAIKNRGQILTFKKPVRWMGEEYKQIIIDKNSIQKRNKRYYFSTPWYDSDSFSSLEELADLIDWKDAEERANF